MPRLCRLLTVEYTHAMMVTFREVTEQIQLSEFHEIRIQLTPRRAP